MAFSLFPLVSNLYVGGKKQYNLEFQGSVQNLQKRALFMKCLEITQLKNDTCVKITLLLAKSKRKLLGKLPRNPHVMKIVERKLEALRVKYFSRNFVGNSYC